MKHGDPIAVITLIAVAVAALATSWFLPWWTMEARAPQYGQRVLVVDVSPRAVEGDVFELDALGHYVGIRPLGTLAKLERAAAPFGLALATVGLVIAPFLTRRRWRALALLPVIVLPALFLLDLGVWMHIGTNRRDPDAALNLTIKNIDTKLIGKYAVGQFSVEAAGNAGLFGAGTAALVALGLIFVQPLPVPSRRRLSQLAGAAVVLLAAGHAQAGTVADLIARAPEGATVTLPPGVHREHLVIQKRITLAGEGAILDGEGRGTVVRVEAPGVELRGLTVRSSGDNYNAEDAAIRLQRASGVTLADVRIEDALFGVFAVEADGCRVERTTIRGRDVPEEKRGDGIRLWYSSGCTLAHNRVDRSRDVVIWYSRDTVVEDNHVTRGRYGLHYMYSDHNAFRRNRFEQNLVGAAIMYSRGVELTDNTFSFSTGVSAYGLLIKDADDVFVNGNRFVGNATALFFDGTPLARGARAEVRGNLIARNDVGLALEPRCRGIRIWENALVGNRTQVAVMGTGLADGNFWSVGGRGNYWSDAIMYDKNGDGVSELPYRAESTYEALADRYPVLGLFDGTPGAEAIDLAARLFPFFAPRAKLVDEHPLVRPQLAEWLDGRREHAGPSLLLAGAALLAAFGFLVRRRWS